MAIAQLQSIPRARALLIPLAKEKDPLVRFAIVKAMKRHRGLDQGLRTLGQQADLLEGLCRAAWSRTGWSIPGAGRRIRPRRRGHPEEAGEARRPRRASEGRRRPGPRLPRPQALRRRLVGHAAGRPRPAAARGRLGRHAGRARGGPRRAGRQGRRRPQGGEPRPAGGRTTRPRWSRWRNNSPPKRMWTRGPTCSGPSPAWRRRRRPTSSTASSKDGKAAGGAAAGGRRPAWRRSRRRRPRRRWRRWPRRREPVGAAGARRWPALGVLKTAGRQGRLRQRASRATSRPSAPPRRRRSPQTAGGDAVDLLTPLLDDKDAAVRIAAVQGLGSLKNKAAVPALLQGGRRRGDAVRRHQALAQMPDARALSAYLTGLGSKNADLRTACKAAIAAVRDEAAPALEQLVKGNEVKPELSARIALHLLRSYAPILQWKLIGPFPRDGKAYPPETEQKFDAVYTSFDKHGEVGGPQGRRQAARPDEPGPPLLAEQRRGRLRLRRDRVGDRPRRRAAGRQRRHHHDLAQRQEGPRDAGRPRLELRPGQGPGSPATRA